MTPLLALNVQHAIKVENPAFINGNKVIQNFFASLLNNFKFTPAITLSLTHICLGVNIRSTNLIGILLSPPNSN